MTAFEIIAMYILLASCAIAGVWMLSHAPLYGPQASFSYNTEAAALLCIGGGLLWGIIREDLYERTIIRFPDTVPMGPYSDKHTVVPCDAVQSAVWMETGITHYPGWSTYHDTHQYRIWEDAAWIHCTAAVEEPPELIPEGVIASLLSRIVTTYVVSERRLFGNGVIIGMRQSIWDRLFLLGPKYLVWFPYGASIVATHMNGLAKEK